MNYDPDLFTKVQQLEAIVAQQAAVIECQKRDFDEVLEALGLLSFYCDGITRTDAPPRDIYNQTFKIYRKHKDAPIALQPCPEVLNKVRADAAMAAISWVWSQGSVLPREAYSYVKRIERGEA